MKNVWRRLGLLLYVLCWPLVLIYLHNSKRCRILVVYNSKVLVTKNWLGTHKRWGLPGGGIHKYETPQIAATRELNEETGIAINPNQLIPLSHEYVKYNIHRFYCYYFFITLKKSPVLIYPHGEILASSWLGVSKLNSANAQPDVLRALELWKGLRSFATIKPGSD